MKKFQNFWSKTGVLRRENVQNVIKIRQEFSPTLEMNIILNIQSPGYYAESLKCKTVWIEASVGI